MNRRGIERLLSLTKELQLRDARTSFPVFLDYISASYDRQWFHTLIARRCQSLLDGTLGKDRLMLFVPPQHGKSEIASRKFPAWALGVNPTLKIVGTSYSSDLAQQFSRAIQRTIDDENYHRIFPDTCLNGSGIKTDKRSWLRNADTFETVGYGGFYKAVGVGGSLTGTPADLGIIDDPVKDALEAGSQTYRDRVWAWYTDVFSTRLHNKSKQILIMTRWHDDDLAGRLLQSEPDKWEVVSIPAICEDTGMREDPRKIGEALWEDRHSLDRLQDIERRSPRTFAALYQQHPTINGGNIVKREWFKTIKRKDFDRIHDTQPIVFFIDTAYTDNTANDPTGIIATCKIRDEIYITHATSVRLKFPELIRFVINYATQNGYGRGSSVRIEPKANGLSVIDTLREGTALNVVSTPTPQDSKETRLFAASPTVECGRVYLIADTWNEDFIDEVCGFPSKPHDEYVDLLTYAIDYYSSQSTPIDLGRLAKRLGR